ncbi:MAG: PAS domain S-box protein, partial [Coriobacteriia bacterium]|nr:PAS domain S-box protein [Coriobacteriia bacterium]
MRPASRIALAYALIASVWIVTSDVVTYAFMPPGPTAQTIKGLLFVAVTSASLWYLLERHERRRERLARRTNQVQRQLSALVETSPMAIIAVNPDGVVTLWNPAAERIFGWSAAEALGKPNPTVPGPENGEFEQSLKSTLEGREILGSRQSRIRRDGTPVDVLVYSAVIQPDDPDTQPSVFALIADVTEQVHAEEELA